MIVSECDAVEETLVGTYTPLAAAHTQAPLAPSLMRAESAPPHTYVLD